MNKESRTIEVYTSTAHYLDMLCCRYNLNPNTIVMKGMELLELHLAEIEARRAAIQRDD